jgi:hypothetical protein
MVLRSLMSKTWMPSKPVHGDGAAAQLAPLGLPFRATRVHSFVSCGDSRELNVLHLERGSCRTARDDVNQPAHEQVHEEREHAAPIPWTPTNAQIGVFRPHA